MRSGHCRLPRLDTDEGDIGGFDRVSHGAGGAAKSPLPPDGQVPSSQTPSQMQPQSAGVAPGVASGDAIGVAAGRATGDAAGLATGEAAGVAPEAGISVPTTLRWP